MKLTTRTKKMVTALLISAMSFGQLYGIVPDTAKAAERTSVNSDAVDAEIDVEKIDLPEDFLPY